MRFSSLVTPLAAPALFLLAQGCAPSLAQPFDQMKSAPITVYRLQNFEPPPQAPTAAAAPTLQLPPQIAEWMEAGAKLLPPGLLPQGLLPGSAPPPPPTTQDVMRFHGFRILGWKAIPDQKTHDDLLDILGHDSNFVVQHDGCMFAEFGFSIQQPGPQPADVLVSLSCDQAVAASGFAWPYSKNGIPSDTAKRLVTVVQATFGGG